MRFRAEVEQCCDDLDYRSLYFWDPMDGLTDSKNNSESESTEGFLDVLEKIAAGEKNAVYVLEYADGFYTGGNENVAPMFAVTIRKLRARGIHIIVFSPTLKKMPKILEKEFAVLDFPLPGRKEIKTLLEDVADKHSIQYDTAPPILDAVRGLGATEIINAFAKTAVYHDRITAEEIRFLVAEKEQIIRKSGYLTFIRPDNSMDSVGGLENLRKWFKRRKDAFGKDAREKKLNAPKGVLLLGVPGTGKSLCAKAVAQEWKMPLLRLDMGSIYSSGVGDSEANMRSVIRVAESMEPCILWIDEIEKGMSGGASGELDGGTSTRVFGSFLTWMQEKTKEVFIFATANDISRLPPEMLRKGRFDEIFFVDLPGKKARKEIFKIHLKGKEQNDKIVADDLINETEGFSGAEIEAVVNDALFMSYTRGSSPEIKTAHLHEAAEQIVPLSQTMKDMIKDIREWANNGRCRLANEEEPPKIKSLPPGGVLPSEVYNPFKKGGDKK